MNNDYRHDTPFIEANIVLAMQTGDVDGLVEAERLVREMSSRERRELKGACDDVSELIRSIER